MANLSRTFVGFSRSDIRYYRLMCAWKRNDNIDFNFADCQLNYSIDSEDENYIKRKCREALNNAGTFIQLIGEDTKRKYKYVRWEAEVAIEKGCRIICVNLDGARIATDLCPPILKNIGAIFVPFSPDIVQYALDNYEMKDDGNYHYKNIVYEKLGYGA